MVAVWFDGIFQGRFAHIDQLTFQIIIHICLLERLFVLYVQNHPSKYIIKPNNKLGYLIKGWPTLESSPWTCHIDSSSKKRNRLVLYMVPDIFSMQ
jgi:hypothetical protein